MIRPKHFLSNNDIKMYSITENDEQIRQNTYDTLPRSVSEVSLQNNNSQQPVRPDTGRVTVIDPIGESRLKSPSEEKSNANQTEQKSKSENVKLSFRKHSMADLGLAKPRVTQFDEEEEDLEEGEEAPGAFKRPSSAFKLAK